jgi:hypothetical protein
MLPVALRRPFGFPIMALELFNDGGYLYCFVTKFMLAMGIGFELPVFLLPL